MTRLILIRQLLIETQDRPLKNQLISIIKWHWALKFKEIRGQCPNLIWFRFCQNWCDRSKRIQWHEQKWVMFVNIITVSVHRSNAERFSGFRRSESENSVNWKKYWIRYVFLVCSCKNIYNLDSVLLRINHAFSSLISELLNIILVK